MTLAVACGPSGSPGGVPLALPDSGTVDQAETRTPEVFKALVGADGGDIAPIGGPLEGFRLVIPAGALIAEGWIKCTQVGDVKHPLYAGAGPAAHCTPDDAPFEKEIQITVPYDDAKLPAGGAAALSVLQLIDGGNVEAIGEVTVDLNAKTVTISNYHLGVLQAAKVAPTTGRGG